MTNDRTISLIIVITIVALVAGFVVFYILRRINSMNDPEENMMLYNIIIWIEGSKKNEWEKILKRRKLSKK